MLYSRDLCIKLVHKEEKWNFACIKGSTSEHSKQKHWLLIELSDSCEAMETFKQLRLHFLFF